MKVRIYQKSVNLGQLMGLIRQKDSQLWCMLDCTEYISKCMQSCRVWENSQNLDEGVSADFVPDVFLAEVAVYELLLCAKVWWVSRSRVCVFLCTSRSILSAADVRTAGGRVEGSSVCVCINAFACACVCWDSLQRKLGMCWITQDMEDGWLVNSGGWTDGVINTHTHTHTHQNHKIINI